jgi:predicted phage-related endonuclease
MSVEHPIVTVGSSDVSSILGINPWSAPSETWARLVGILPRYSSDGNAATRRGRIIESALLDEWARLRSPELMQRGPSIADEPIVVDQWRACRPDALAEVSGKRLIVEAKTTRKWDAWGPDGSAGVPVYYAAQVAWQLSVIGCETAEVIAFCPMDDEIRCYTITRNLDLEAKLVARVKAWMERHVWAAVPEVPSARTLSVVAAQYADGGREATWLDATEDDAALARELVVARGELRAAEIREAELRTKFCARIGDAYGVKGVCTWGSVKGRETVDAQALREGFPEVYAKVAKRGASSRQFRLTFKEQGK